MVIMHRVIFSLLFVLLAGSAGWADETVENNPKNRRQARPIPLEPAPDPLADAANRLHFKGPLPLPTFPSIVPTPEFDFRYSKLKVLFKF